MRVIDLISDMAETSAKLHARGALSPDQIAELTGRTLIRPDLAGYLQQSIGPEIRDPAERLCAMVLRMGEIARAWAGCSVFHHDFGAAGMQADRNGLGDESRRHPIRLGHASNEDGAEATLAEVEAGRLGPVDYVSAFSREADALSALASAVVNAPALQGATALILGPWSALRDWLEASGASPTQAGPLLHLGEASPGYLYFVRIDRREIRA